MKKIVVYVRNKNIRPSDYYRVVQYTKRFDGEVIIRSAIPDKVDRWCLGARQKSIVRILSLIICYFFVLTNFLWGYVQDKKLQPQAVIVVRELFPRKMLPFVGHMLKKHCQQFEFIWDFDDSIIGTEISNGEAEIYFQYAKHIVVSTPYLKEHLPESVWDKTSVLPTTDGDLADINLNLINEKRKETYKSVINIVWVATINNIPNLLDVLDYLDLAAKKIGEQFGKEVHLKVVCNGKVEKVCKNLIVDNITWSRDRALEEIKNAHIGIMPLMNNQFALGKAGFKLIQYLSGGLPVIASDTGFNASILNDKIGYQVKQNAEEEWINAIVNLSKNYDEWNDYSVKALEEWNEKYSFQEHLDFWNNLLMNLK